ncbi:GNAT family N-acetyltransferase [Desulfopila sp. IMCC35006]|uniref:GNAT family N-acetyltransferase n=1 Tax=Desulfopila sp. IMCC35006 TaxID=2569542 RepID=UPI0010ACD99E|nr:GNAT family N-acetyltransferase [Desulfopila sp. IMCC35006]TKB25642.1 GNAT family N-acetyltransferase [Desulfopila sp. IMCC35006]
MKVDITYSCAGINWTTITAILKQVGMAHHAPDEHRKAFEASFTTVFAWNKGQLVGFGRAISDGVYQAAVYDVAVVPEFQGQGVGSAIMKHLLKTLPQCNVILYASPGKEGFYTTLSFKKMKTGMALFKNGAAMTERGFTD